MSQVLTTNQGLEMLTTGDFIELGQAANRMREQIHPDPVVTFIVDRNINYTNICTSECRFCAFYRKEGDPRIYLIRGTHL